MADVAFNNLEEAVEDVRGAFEDLDEGAIAVDEHAGDVEEFVLDAGLVEELDQLFIRHQMGG